MSILFFFYVMLFYFCVAIRHEVGIAVRFVGSDSLFGLSGLSFFVIFDLWHSAVAGWWDDINILWKPFVRLKGFRREGDTGRIYLPGGGYPR